MHLAPRDNWNQDDSKIDSRSQTSGFKWVSSSLNFCPCNGMSLYVQENYSNNQQNNTRKFWESLFSSARCIFWHHFAARYLAIDYHVEQCNRLLDFQQNRRRNTEKMLNFMLHVQYDCIWYDSFCVCLLLRSLFFPHFFFQSLWCCLAQRH